MDEEQTAGYREPCMVCSAVDWGVSDEGRFFCKSCHNVIERTREVVDPNLTPGATRISTIGRGTRTKKTEHGRQWKVCEGFQFILRNQADTLVSLGVSAHFKDAVLCQLWRMFLQKSRQAYTLNPVKTSSFKVGDPGSETSASETDPETVAPSAAASLAGSCSDASQCSGSLDAGSFLSAQQRGSGTAVMSMRKTLALIHLALTWSREPLTLSDLLRLVSEGHVPYVNAYEDLPDEMKLEGKDALFFRVQSVPTHRAVHKDAQSLVLFLQLPAFPPIGRQSLLHPALLSLRYLTEANLPDELHPWLLRLLDCAGLADEALHTFDPVSGRVLPRYDLQAAAIVIVTMKLLFGLDDHTEWDLSNDAGDHEDAGNMFSLRRWFRLLAAALTDARSRRQSDVARKQWTARRPLYATSEKRCARVKKKRVAEQVTRRFGEAVLDRPVGGGQRGPPCSFLFCWGGDGGAGPSLHSKKLDAALILGGDPSPANPTYWHPDLRLHHPRLCKSHFSEDSLPQSFVWLLQFFCFLLDVGPLSLYNEVLRLERRLVRRKSGGRKRRFRGRGGSSRGRGSGLSAAHRVLL
ncbi:LOW QUALITY PROTEIN: TATA box-binding protein-associated factor RNA polymerase I subunit B [Eleginops maclovinus]|uniref:LOW QUALITY PROTEIN: TATA box-binding protein-associated factor RNA polymerase I subunit B n=1 Tax=Eleginops maclovinus TaxID=56733 RepID=UPI003080E4E7